MYKFFIFLTVFVVSPLDHAPWGWNSYDFVKGWINETKLEKVVEGFQKQLQPMGFTHVNLDEGWHDKSGYFDDYGRPSFNQSAWPKATEAGTMKVYSDWLNDLGLKFGMYWTRGVHHLAANKTVKGTPYKISDIVSHAKHANCPWGGGQMWLGINATHPGAQPYYNSLIELFVEWGVHMLKIDCIEFNRDDIYMLQKAIELYNNSILLSLSPGGKFRREWGQELVVANYPVQYRIVNDFHGGWWEMLGNLQQGIQFIDLVGLNNTWPDLDMIPFGDVGCDYNATHCNGGHAKIEEVEFFMTAYMIAKSPLLFGGKLPDETGFVEQYLNNKVALAVNADSENNRIVTTGNATEHSTWTADFKSCPALSTGDSCTVWAIFNLIDNNLTVTVPFNSTFGKNIYHIWNNTVETYSNPINSLTIEILYHTAAFFLLQ